MSKDLAKLGGIIQALFGAAGQFIPGTEDLLSPQQPLALHSNIFNIGSGILLAAAGFMRSGTVTKAVGVIIGLLNAAAGVLGVTGNSSFAGIQLNTGTPQVALHFIIAAVGLLTLFIKKKK